MAENAGSPDWPRRDYSDFLRRHGRDDEAAALEKTQPSLDAARAGKGITPPQPISRREPDYSEAARVRRFVGTVILTFVIDQSGVPVNIEVLEPLDEKAIAAVEAWRFRPGSKDGDPVKVRATMEVKFRLL